MAYLRTFWKTGDVITNEKMNNIENGIENAENHVHPSDPTKAEKYHSHIVREIEDLAEELDILQTNIDSVDIKVGNLSDHTYDRFVETIDSIRYLDEGKFDDVSITGNDLNFVANNVVKKTITIPSTGGGGGGSLTLGNTSTTAYRGDYGEAAYNHSKTSHAPSNAQKNSDITKSEIEAKLTGGITSHTHSISSVTNLQTNLDTLNAFDAEVQFYCELMSASLNALGITKFDDVSINGNVLSFLGADEVRKTVTIPSADVTKSYVDTEVAKKANTSHSHTKSQITDLGTIPAINDTTASSSSVYSSEKVNTLIANAQSGGTIDLSSYATKSELSSKVDKVSGKSLISDSEITRLASVSNYTHPTSHGASMITQDSSNRFVTDSEKSTWNNKSTLALGTSSSTAYRGDYGNIAYTHSQSAHAPSSAQKNSDITKSEIEAKLTGEITSHTHSISGVTNLQTSLDAITTSIGALSDHTYDRFIEVTDTISSMEESKLALGTSSSTAYRGDYGNTAYTHSQAAHAPTSAQKNSDITKSEIEAKLTGTITSHTHSYEPVITKNSAFNVAFETTATNIKVNGTQALGSLSTVARADHVHPTDTSRAASSHTHTKSQISDFPTIPTVTNDLTTTLKSNYDTAYNHSQAAHAPTSAQKNSDITKSEIEAKLTGSITSHTHKVESDVGDLTMLSTTDKTNIVNAINEVLSNAESSMEQGNLAEYVANEAFTQIGTLSNLITTDKTNMVNAINEVANGGNADTVCNYSIWVGTATNYSAIATKSSSTIYIITG